LTQDVFGHARHRSSDVTVPLDDQMRAEYGGQPAQLVDASIRSASISARRVFHPCLLVPKVALSRTPWPQRGLTRLAGQSPGG
jgi:hypothetical protein